MGNGYYIFVELNVLFYIRSVESDLGGGFMSENRCYGKVMELGCESYDKLDKEMVDDWNDEIGLLIDDNIIVEGINV